MHRTQAYTAFPPMNWSTRTTAMHGWSDFSSTLYSINAMVGLRRRETLNKFYANDFVRSVKLTQLWSAWLHANK